MAEYKAYEEAVTDGGIDLWDSRNMMSVTVPLVSFTTIHMNWPDTQAVLYDERESCAFLAFRLGAAAFFKITADPMDFQQVVGRLTYTYGLQQYKKDAKGRSLMVKTKEGYHIIRFSDILFIERSARKTNMVCVKGQSIQISNYILALSGFEGEIILSREKHREVVELLQKYYSDVRL